MKTAPKKQTNRLTSRQRKLVIQINELMSRLGLDIHEVIDSSVGLHRTVRLELIRNHFIRGEVITSYTLIDDCLGNKLRAYYFRTSKGSLKDFRRSKKIANFNLLLDEMSLMQKLRQLKNIKPIPSSVSRNIERINSLRNKMAHIYWFDSPHSSKYKGKDIFSSAGLDVFMEDVQSIYAYFYPRLYDIDETETDVEE